MGEHFNDYILMFEFVTLTFHTRVLDSERNMFLMH